MSDLFDLDVQKARLSRRSQATHPDEPTLPPLTTLRAAESTLPDPNSAGYLSGGSQEDTVKHIVRDIIPALNGQGLSPHYYGFVTGGVLPIAEWADNVVSRMDQNVQVHLPDQTIATALEDATLKMIISLLRLGDAEAWKGRTFTTGATASNVLGLACGREALLAKRLGSGESTGELGLLGACLKAGVTEVQVLTSGGHSSLSKAASIVGLGRRSVKELRAGEDVPWRLDLVAFERELQKTGTLSIISISAGEVNTGRYGVNGVEEMRRVRELADKYGAWIHVDGAFGIFARALEAKPEYKVVREYAEGLELADSITVDGHKLLNVPYDCGMFFTKSPEVLQSAFVNPNAAYLASGSQASIPSPLNIGIENSRRFRALPAYAVLLSEGRSGISSLLSNMTDLCRRVAGFIQQSEHYELLPDEQAPLDEIFMIVLFRAKNKELNGVLVQKINDTRKIYVSETKWKGEKAVRIAVSNWMVNVSRDFDVISSTLNAVADGNGDD
ncbi:Uncharacterized protein SAPIO_CDS7996 [Scedosporium apiospermum]|uniref:L-2,4-diaminobutyrate decarboxylase n=1 Tax=Pseudallescheria apiosperma TaxID=563466 RepID=A0A084G0H7_PSEDA|nr:Uncharacterized protein SAPIO_CDS7996 [Scedosporium apiospermum]KEZ40839.1 Uncharacterized protein SAPIO_CDS7996 [Scedosporium apiospermum]